MIHTTNQTKIILQTAQTSLILETVGLTVSIISLTISLYIFCKYRVLKNNRTKIHKNLFISILLEAVVRLIYYIDKFSKYKIIHSNVSGFSFIKFSSSS